MKKRKKIVRIATGILSLFLLLPVVGCGRNDTVTHTHLTFTNAPPPSYKPLTKRQAGEKLHTAMYDVLLESQGASVANVWKKNENGKEMLVRLGDTFERRGVLEEEYTQIVDGLCEEKALLTNLLQEDEQSLTAFTAFFGKLCARVGVARSALIAYDSLLEYCTYQEESYADRYAAHPEYGYLLVEKESWTKRKAGVTAIGEGNFSTLLRFWFGCLSTFSRQTDGQTGGEFISSMYSGEIAFFLRTQGRVLEELRLTEADYAFLIAFAGEVGKIPLFAAITQANKAGEYAKHMDGIRSGISIALSASGEEVGSRLLEGDIGGALEKMWDGLTETQKTPFENALAVENAESAYMQYIKNKNWEGKFNAYTQKTRVGVEARVYESSPQLAFLVFGL